eukprot:15473105-Alexandrium_andersonii.AAC.1
MGSQGVNARVPPVACKSHAVTTDRCNIEPHCVFPAAFAVDDKSSRVLVAFAHVPLVLAPALPIDCLGLPTPREPFRTGKLPLEFAHMNIIANAAMIATAMLKIGLGVLGGNVKEHYHEHNLLLFTLQLQAF